MREKTTILGILVVIGASSLVAWPPTHAAPPLPVPDRAESPAYPLPEQVVRRVEAHAPTLAAPQRPAAPGGEQLAMHEAARSPLRIAIEAPIRPLLELTLRSIGRGPDRADWAGGPVFDAFERVLDGRSEIAFAAREPSPQERARGLGEIRVGELVLAVVVHPSNPIHSLSRERMRDLLRGSVVDWSQAGGAPGAVRFIAATPGPTADLLARLAIAGDRFATSGQALEPHSARVRAVAADPMAVTLVPLGAAITADVRIVAIDGELPNLGTVHCGRYPFACPIVLGYADAHSARVAAFLADLRRPVARSALVEVLCLQ